jgi:excisionase family DNA binding protein
MQQELMTTAAGMPRKRFLSIKEAAAYLGLSPNTIYSWKSQGIHIPTINFGRRVFVDAADLEQFIASCKREPSNEATNGRVQ